MADLKIAYGTPTAITITLASLASSAGLTAGQESTAVDNSTNKYVDVLVSGKITTGTSPTTAKAIYVYVYGTWDGTNYPDVLDGTDSAETITSSDIRNSALVLAAVMNIDNTSDRTYWFRPFSIAACFGGRMPQKWGIFVVHDTAVNLNSTAGNHSIYYTPIYYTVA